MTGFGYGFTPDRRDAKDGPQSGAGKDDLLARAALYSHWDGSQAVPNLDADEILEALADDVMAEGDVASALRRLMDRGWRSTDPTRHSGCDEYTDFVASRATSKNHFVSPDPSSPPPEMNVETTADVSQRQPPETGSMVAHPPPHHAPRLRGRTGRCNRDRCLVL